MALEDASPPRGKRGRSARSPRRRRGPRQVGFYIGRETFHGVSASTLLWALLRDVIIYLYLLDADAGSLVLFSLMSSMLASFLKILYLQTFV